MFQSIFIDKQQSFLGRNTYVLPVTFGHPLIKMVDAEMIPKVSGASILGQLEWGRKARVLSVCIPISHVSTKSYHKDNRERTCRIYISFAHQRSSKHHEQHVYDDFLQDQKYGDLCYGFYQVLVMLSSMMMHSMVSGHENDDCLLPGGSKLMTQYQLDADGL
jgi:hypothetical protein